MTDIADTLAERQTRYGDFLGHAVITQGIKKVMADSPKWVGLSPDKKEALEMVAHKIGRILNGDPEYADSWHDIIGYTKLVEDALAKEAVAIDLMDRSAVGECIAGAIKEACKYERTDLDKAKDRAGKVVVMIEEKASTHKDGAPTLYARFSRIHGVIEPHTLYRVNFIGTSSFNLLVGSSSKAFYESDSRIHLTDNSIRVLRSHARYYK